MVYEGHTMLNHAPYPHFASFPDFIGLDRSVIIPEMGWTVRVFP